MNYQERCDTRADIRALYNKVINDPNIKCYRGYTNTHSYGWDESTNDYIKIKGEMWFDNPAYDPNYDPEQTPRIIGPTVADVAIAEMEADKPRILDSGNRRQFETGAVRDIHDGKGRCDLLPLDVVALVNGCGEDSHIIRCIDDFCKEGALVHLCGALEIFTELYFKNSMPHMFLELAKHFEEGCKKYGDNNWQKGIPTHCYIDSAVRHYLKYLRGDKDEPHDRAFCWNILCCIWTCIHKPELNDYAPKEEKDADSAEN